MKQENENTLIHAFEAATAVTPKDKENLARVCSRLGKLKAKSTEIAQAMLFASKAKALGVETPDNDLIMAGALTVMGEGKAAATLCRKVLKSEPENRRGQILLGRALFAGGDYKGARQAHQAALEIDPGDGEVLVDLGLALEALGRPEEAADYFDQVKINFPELFEALMDRADRLVSRYLNQAASDQLQKAGKIARKDARLFYEMAVGYFVMGCGDLAEKTFLKAIRLRPLPEAYHELAALYERSNNVEKALSFARVYSKSLPDYPPLNLILAHCQRRKVEFDAALELYQKVLDMTDEIPIKVEALNNIGRIFDRQEKIDEAYEKFNAAKVLVKQSEGFDSIDLIEQHMNLKKMATLEIPHYPLGKISPKGEFEPKQLVFFIGFPRSGTTLIHEVLDGHPEIVISEEAPALRQVVNLLEKFSSSYPASLEGLSREQIKDLRALYFYQAKCFTRFDATSTLVDKLPLNLLQLPLILTLFPEARIIFAVRHPKGCTLSCLMQNFGLNNAMVNMTGLDEITAYYVLVMGIWKEITHRRKLPFHYVKYENVVGNLERETRKLLGFLGLEWRPEVLDYAARARIKGLINTPSYHQVIQPVYKDSLKNWRRYDAYFKPFEGRLEPFIKMFGYDG